MTFRYERDMTATVEAWLTSRGLHSKREVPLPWAVCDLVGIRFNNRRVGMRLRYGQRQAIPSILRLRLLLQTPECGEPCGRRVEDFHAELRDWVPASVIDAEIAQLVRGRFLSRDADGCYWKRNGWLPVNDRVVAVELKLARFSDVVAQASAHTTFADESYVAMPLKEAQSVASGSHLERLQGVGLGLLGVTARRCRELLRPRRVAGVVNEQTQYHVVEKLWTSYARTLRDRRLADVAKLRCDALGSVRV